MSPSQATSNAWRSAPAPAPIAAATAAFAKRLEAAIGNNAKREVLEELVETLVRRILGLGDLPLERASAVRRARPRIR